jgi:hypothetical protein
MQWEIETQTKRGKHGKNSGVSKTRRSAAASD